MRFIESPIAKQKKFLEPQTARSAEGKLLAEQTTVRYVFSYAVTSSWIN
jgi:hypothetical protein